MRILSFKKRTFYSCKTLFVKSNTKLMSLYSVSVILSAVLCVSKIEAADNTTLMECTDRILSCGYTGAVSIQRKEGILLVPVQLLEVDADF